MKSFLALFLIFGIFACKENNDTEAVEPSGLEGQSKEYQLVWADEFETLGKPDTAKWAYEIGFIRNNEEQYYTDSLKNARVEDGFLILEAHKETIENKSFVSANENKFKKNRPQGDYTSASITTKDLAEWQYGKIEVRAKLAGGTGTWPAIWMLGENLEEVGWPDCGEIDIMEHVGFNKDSIFGTAHTKAFNHNIGTEVGKSIFIDSPYEDFHVYAVEWTPEKIDFILDGAVYHTFENRKQTSAEWPFDQPFHLKLNLAIGGAWGGQQGIDDSIFPQRMTIDYARVYQSK